MRVKDLKKHLDQNNIAVEQWEITIIKSIKKQEKLFETSCKEININTNSRKEFEKKIADKIKAFGKSVDEISDYSNYIQDFENISTDELEKQGNQIISDIEKTSTAFWNDEDKMEFNIIYSRFIELKKKITITNHISNFFLKYSATKTLIQLIIFSLSFFSSYYLGQKLEPYFNNFNDISVQFFIAVILFLTLEKILEKLEEYLVYWRVCRLFQYFRMIMPLTEKLKSKQ